MVQEYKFYASRLDLLKETKKTNNHMEKITAEEMLQQCQLLSKSHSRINKEGSEYKIMIKAMNDFASLKVKAALENQTKEIWDKLPSEEIEQLLHNISQVFDGWKSDDPKAWSDFDSIVRKSIDEFRIKYTYKPK